MIRIKTSGKTANWWVPLVLSACAATTTMTSLKDPELVADLSFSRIVVYFPLADLRLRQVVENEFLDTDRKGSFLASHRVFFPERAYTEEEIQDILARSGGDAVLVLSLSDAGANSQYLPAASTTICTFSNNQGCTQAQTINSGGYAVDRPWASFEATLFDPASGQSVWVAAAESEGNAWADAEDLLRSLARRTVTQLRADGLIR